MTSEPLASLSCSCSRASNQRPLHPTHRSTCTPAYVTFSIGDEHFGHFSASDSSRVCPAMLVIMPMVPRRESCGNTASACPLEWSTFLVRCPHGHHSHLFAHQEPDGGFRSGERRVVMTTSTGA